MWTLIGGGAAGEAEPVPVGGLLEHRAVHALIGDLHEWSLPEDDLVPVPGCDPQGAGHGRYWLTGKVGQDVRVISHGLRFWQATHLFLLTVNGVSFVAKLVASRRVKLRPGSRLTVECVFLLRGGWRSHEDDLPEEWRSSWQVLAHAGQGKFGPLVNLEPAEQDGEAEPVQRHRRTPLLLDTDYGGGPLWYRSLDNTTPWALDVGYFPLSRALCERLVRWAAADYHTHDDYEDDDPEHEVAWHEEGLALLAELRRQLGPSYDIKFAHDLDA